jgi:hypothetical protein
MELVMVAGLLGTLVVALVHGATKGGTGRPTRRLSAQRRAIAEVRDGERVTIVGRIVEAPPLIAPVTRRPCVYFAAHKVRPPRTRTWARRSLLVDLVDFAVRSAQKEWSDTRCVTFVIEDPSGHADVDPTGAEITVEPVRHGEIVQRALEVGEWIVVTGVATYEPDPDGAARATGYRDAPLRARFASSSAAPLAIRHADPNERPTHARLLR